MLGREGRSQFLIRAGFLRGEARELSHTSRAGLHAPYFQGMINARRSLKLNAIRWGWSEERYRQTIKQLYQDRGAIRYDAWGRAYGDYWKMLRWYEDRSPIPKDEYTSPWRKKIERKSTAKRQIKRTTRRSMLVQWIKELDDKIAKAQNEFRKKKLTEQRDRLQRQLEQMER